MAGASAAAAIVAFDSAGGRWLTEAEARGVPHARVPELDGELRRDRATREASSTDHGQLRHVVPWAVLLPGSVADIQKMVRFCREHKVPVAQRGQHHSMHGQSLSPGLVIERGQLTQVHHIGADHAVADAGVTFKELLQATLSHGLRPRVMPGFAGLSLGGQISVGGCPMIGQLGGTVDSVRALQVVTGAGDVVDCSDTVNADLFEAALGGLGQFGVITRVTFDLVPAKTMARTWIPTYPDAASMFADLRTLHERGEVDEVYHVSFPPASPAFAFQLNVTKYFDPGEEPDTAFYLRDLRYPAAAAPPQDRPFFEWATFVDSLVDVMRATVQWDALEKPWYDVWLTEEAVEAHVTDVLSNLAPDDVGAGGFVLLFPHKRSQMRRPFYRVPEGGAADRVWLFDLATTSMAPVTEPGYEARMVARNRALFEKAKAMGGLRYMIGALDFGRADWEHHFGERWADFMERKRRYDPDNIMTPGMRIFP